MREPTPHAFAKMSGRRGKPQKVEKPCRKQHIAIVDGKPAKPPRGVKARRFVQVEYKQDGVTPVKGSATEHWIWCEKSHCPSGNCKLIEVLLRLPNGHYLTDFKCRCMPSRARPKAQSMVPRSSKK